MVSAERGTGSRFSTVHRSAAQHRILDAALTLIADYGVGGTSLQMIADEVGVTKAAVYHQFKTKEEIVIALTERELGRLVMHPLVADVDDDTLRSQLLLLTRRLLALPE